MIWCQNKKQSLEPETDEMDGKSFRSNPDIHIEQHPKIAPSSWAI